MIELGIIMSKVCCKLSEAEESGKTKEQRVKTKEAYKPKVLNYLVFSKHLMHYRLVISPQWFERLKLNP